MTRFVLTLTAAAAVALTTAPASASYGRPCLVECLPCTDGSCWHVDPPEGPFVGCFRTPDTTFCI